MSVTMQSPEFRLAARRLLNNPAIHESLDRLATETITKCSAFFDEQIGPLHEAGFQPEDAEAIMVLVVGWMVGYFEAEPESRQLVAALSERLGVAAFAASYSAGLHRGLASPRSIGS